MTAIDPKNAQKWDEMEALMHKQVGIMVDKARETGYYGSETMILHARMGVPNHIDIESKTQLKT